MRYALLLTLCFLSACASKFTIANDVVGTYARITDHSGRVVADKVYFGTPVTLDPDGVLTSSNVGAGSTTAILLTASGFRTSDNCPLGSVTYQGSTYSGNGVTSPPQAWHITGFYASGQTIGSKGECLSR